MNAITQCKILSLLILVFGVLTIIVFIPSENEVLVEDTLYMVNDTSVADIRAIAVSNAQGVFGVVNSSQGITLATDIRQNFDSTILASYIYSMSKIKAIDSLDVDSADFNLSNPLSQVTIISGDGVGHEYVLLSKSTVSEDEYFLLRKEDNQIFLIEESQASLFLQSVLDFVKIQLVPYFDFENASLISNISVKYNNEIYYQILNQGDMNFTLTSPITAKIDTVRLFEYILFPIASLNSMELLAEEPSIQKSHYYEIEIVTNERTVIQIYEDANTYYAFDGINWYQGRDLQTDFLTATYLELLNNVVYNVAIASLDYVEVKRNNDSVAFIEIKGSGQDMQGTYNGTILDYLQVGSLLEPLNSMRISEVVDNAHFNSGIVEIVLKMRNGTMDIIEISEQQKNGNYFVRVNGVINFMTSERFVLNLLTSFNISSEVL